MSCPDPQMLSVYADGELPSPWKEKMEAHLKQCDLCGKKLANFRKLQNMFKRDSRDRRTYVESKAMNIAAIESTGALAEQETLNVAKDRIWKNLQSRRRFSTSQGLLRRRLSIPLPAAAAAAAAALVILAALILRGGINLQNEEPSSRMNFILASEEEMPGIIPAADMNGVLQYLGSDGSDIIIMRLPESKNFYRSGEPAIVNAADYPRRRQ